MYELATDIASTVPNEQDQIVSFNLTAPSEMILVLENTEPTQAQTIVEELEEKSYVDGVEFLSATTQESGESDMRFDLTIQINPDNRVEGETE